MHILYISNENITIDEALQRLTSYCYIPDELHFYASLQKAKDFLSTNVIADQKHIDFVITDWNFSGHNPKSLLDWIRESKDIYSNQNFQFRSLPVLLIEDTVQQSNIIKEGFNEVIADFPSNRLKLSLAVKSAIKQWRYDLADDLELIGLDPKTQKEYTNDRMNFISYYRLKVLSREFVNTKSKKLNYIWTFPDVRTMYDANQAFFDVMMWTMRNRPRDMEKRIHQFLLQNPTFIKGEDFEGTRNDKHSMLYEKHLYKNSSRRYDEPDFINKPYEFAIRNPEIFEIKRQSQNFLHYKKDKFLLNAKKSIEQVKRYRDYFTSKDPCNLHYIAKYLGRNYSLYDYTLLMGSLSEKLEYHDLIEELKDGMDAKDIRILCYEELLDRHLRLCDRLSEFSIFN